MEQDNKTQGRIVETYAEDMAKVLESDKSGIIKKIIHEEEKHEIEKRNLSPESKKNKLFMLMGFLLIVLGLITLLFFFFKKEASTVPIEKQFTPIVFVDQSSFLEIKGFNKDKIVDTILNEINGTSVKNGGVRGVYLSSDKRVIGLREFITLIKGNFVPNSNTLYVNDNFLMGVVNTKTQPTLFSGGDFFILLKVRSVADIFDSLRVWERKIFFDLHGFFGVDITPETNYLLAVNFEDGIVGNKNGRLL